MTTFNLKEWKLAMSYTNEECAEALGISRATFARYLKNGAPKVVEIACKSLFDKKIEKSIKIKDDDFRYPTSNFIKRRVAITTPYQEECAQYNDNTPSHSGGTIYDDFGTKIPWVYVNNEWKLNFKEI